MIQHFFDFRCFVTTSRLFASTLCLSMQKCYPSNEQIAGSWWQKERFTLNAKKELSHYRFVPVGCLVFWTKKNIFWQILKAGSSWLMSFFFWSVLVRGIPQWRLTTSRHSEPLTWQQDFRGTRKTAIFALQRWSTFVTFICKRVDPNTGPLKSRFFCIIPDCIGFQIVRSHLTFLKLDFGGHFYQISNIQILVGYSGHCLKRKH